MKIRVRPFASLRRGRVVVDAVLSEPSALVAQRKDFSWLGLPAPSEGSPKRHSGEEGIDYRTKTRRLAREKAAEQWNEERDKAAREAAEMGYIVPSAQSISPSIDEMMEDDGPVDTGKSSPHLCPDEMHRKDHHIDAGIDSSSKHADLEKSFGVKARIPGISFWSRMIPNPSRRRYRRKAHSKLISDTDNSSQQRILRCSAYAAVAYFQNECSGNPDDSLPGPGESSSDGGHTNGGGEEGSPNDGPTEYSETTSMDYGELPPEKSNFASTMLIGNTDVLNGSSHNQQPSQISSHSWENNEQVSEAPVLKKRKNISEDDYRQEFDFGAFGSCTYAHNWLSFWPFQLKGFPVRFNAPSASLNVQIQKLRSLFAIGPGDNSAELSQGVGQIHPGAVQQTLPITLDSVYFNGGNLMLLGYGDQEPRFDLVILHFHYKY